MGRRGPAPLPNAQRVATHADRRLDAPADQGVPPPPADRTWHPQALLWYLSLTDTPQAATYTKSEWGHAHTSAALMSAAMRSGDYRAAAAILESAGQRLLATRAARLAAHLDIDEAAPRERAEVIDLPSNDQLRERTFGGA